ncbi:MAG: CDP-diacylglycerol--serine O-phosphatidyltransferase [Parvibaculaceae bacterium]|nr:CDP-diacylglycerol--serine O-phosphatidyltransferase [Parvibaculaceae bacterium]
MTLSPFGSRDRAAGVHQHRSLKTLPIRSLVPNSLTVMALCAGLTSIRFGLDGKFELAVLAICVAAILDGLDGRVARLLKGTTKFGAELDSLSDFLCFGVAPVMLLYLWTLNGLGGLGWIVVLGFAVCCALRLARFNVALEDPDKPAWTANYFIGVPSPAAAGLVMLPLYLSFIGVDFLKDVPVLIAAYVAGIAFLMVSKIPSFSGKRLGMRVRRDEMLPVLLGVALSVAVLFSYPWITLCVLVIGYLAFLPVSTMRYRHHQKRTAFVSDDDEDEFLADSK